MHLFRVHNGRIAEHWHQYDALGMIRQLGGPESVELGQAWVAAEAALPPDRARYTIGIGAVSARRYFAGAYDKFTSGRITVEADTPVAALRELAGRLKAAEPFSEPSRRPRLTTNRRGATRS
jgi:hypothetical protein